jgi:hypothetical protein
VSRRDLLFLFCGSLRLLGFSRFAGTCGETVRRDGVGLSSANLLRRRLTCERKATAWCRLRGSSHARINSRGGACGQAVCPSLVAYFCDGERKQIQCRFQQICWTHWLAVGSDHGEIGMSQHGKRDMAIPCASRAGLHSDRDQPLL